MEKGRNGYRYTDWTKLILFLEWWKTQNVSKFIFYHQSYTKEIHTVLEHYVKEVRFGVLL